MRDRLLGVTLTEHDSGAPVAVGFAGTQVRDDTHKREGEQTVARRLYQQCPLEGAVVTADALHNSDPDARAILEAGGHYFPQVKQENRHSYQTAEKIAQTTPFLPTNAVYFAALARGHWGGCEIRNHWVRDSQMFEDRTRFKDYNINANLATLRCCLLAIKASRLSHLSWPQVIETVQSDQAFAYQLVANYRLK